MKKTYRNILMWALYALLFLTVLLLQDVVFGRQRFLGVKLSLMPVAVVCIAMEVGHEAGGLFALIAALIWHFTGADGGPMCIITWTVSAVAAGWLCDAVYARRFLPALFLSLGALVLCQGVQFLLKFYLEGAALWRWPVLEIVLSLPACVVLHPLSRTIRKVGDV